MLNFNKQGVELKLGENEEKLATELSAFGEVNEGCKKIYMGVDVGSTQTRVMSVSSRQEIEENDDWDSDVLAVPSPLVEIKARGTHDSIDGKIYNNLEVEIIDKTLDKKNKMFSEARILKGSLADEQISGKKVINSSSWKIEQKSFYLNLLTGLATRILLTHQKVGLFDSFEPTLTVSLPPEESESTKDKQTFLDRVSGDYVVNFCRLGKQVNLVIKPENISILAEPEAAFKSFQALMDIEECDWSINIDCGGRSTGISVFHKGILHRGVSTTLPYGGKQIIKELSEIYANVYGGQKPSTKAMEDGFRTGVYKIGRNVKDITELVMKVKKSYAERIYGDLIANVFDRIPDVTPEMIETITYSGRTFRPGNYEDALSIVDYLAELYKNVSQGTEHERIEVENPIVLGCFIKAVLPLMQ